MIPMSDNAIEAKGLAKVHSSSGFTVLAIKNVNLIVKRGSCLLLLGPSGSGKTTLLNLIGLLARPSAGVLLLEDANPYSMSDYFITQLRRRLIGFIFQSYNLLPGFSVIDNVSLPLVPCGVPRKQRHRLASILLDRFGLSGRTFFDIRRLSGGEQQRVAIARALINNPGIILADEPTSSLDQHNAHLILSYLSEIKKSGVTLVIASHDSSLVSAPIVDSVYNVVVN